MNKSSHNHISRRRFLADCGKMTGIGAMSSLLSLRMTNQLMAQNSSTPNDYKALVCIYMFGGLDSYNLLLPGTSGYDQYLNTRGELSIAKESDLNLMELRKIIDNIDGTTSQDFHLNPSALGIKDLFDSNQLSFITNVGSLTQPTDMNAYLAGNNLPYGLFSHNDQVEQWQVSYSTSKTSTFSGTGWMGRMLDVLNDTANASATISPNLSPYGANIAQVGNTTTPFLTNDGVDSLDLYADSDSLVHLGMDATLETQYANVLQAHHNFIRQEAIDQSADLEAIEQNTVINTEFPTSSVGQQLLQIAKYIKANKDTATNNSDGLPDAKRQTFFAGQTGFDTHGGGIETVTSLIQTMNDAIVAFNAAMIEIGAHDEVVSYTASDFGRSLTPNSAGTDHAWGGNQMVIGGPVNGGHVFGQYPDIALGTNTDVGRGRQLPTISVDELHASLAYWFGIDSSNDLQAVVPNIGNYWSIPAGTFTPADYPIPNLFTA